MHDQIEMDKYCQSSKLAGKIEKHDQHPTPGDQSLSEEVSRSRIRITAILLALSVRTSIQCPNTSYPDPIS